MRADPDLNARLRKWSVRRRNRILEQIVPFLTKGDRFLDIGSGSCNVCYDLMELGYDVTGVDIDDLSVFPDGERLPFHDDSFDTSLILQVLHHTANPEEIIKEARRVSKKIIIMEDLITSRIQKYLTFFADSLGNLEFTGHPHSNMSQSGWEGIFDKVNLRIRGQNTRVVSKFLVCSTFFLTRDEFREEGTS